MHMGRRDRDELKKSSRFQPEVIRVYKMGLYSNRSRITQGKGLDSLDIKTIIWLQKTV